IKAACGKFITFLDSDDEFCPSHLESRKALLVKNPAVQFLYGGAKISGNPYVPDRFDYRKKISLDNCIIGGTFFIEKSTAILLKGYKDILLGPDADFFDRAQKANIKIMKTNLTTYLYHHETEDSITNRLLSIYHSK
ncbi:MAG: glycosyltransferase family A protein, partial [Bacteroidota bacterium]|nr:glycosyltransferase family A protein [Bacteroidota bacterium]